MERLTVVEVEGLVKEYGKRRVLDGVSLQIRQGEIFGLLGPNGAGKTTLLETLVGLRIPTSGTARVLGLQPDRDRDKLVGHIGVQPQEASLFPNQTAIETLRLFASFHYDPLPPNQVLAMVGLEEHLDQRVKRLSGGQRQRLVLGCALVANPQILFLDEPTASLDPGARRQLWEVVEERREEGRTVILSTHSMEEAELLCDRVAIIDRGKILAMDSPRALIEQFFPERTVLCVVESELPVDRLRTLPGVIEAKVLPRGGRFELHLQTKDPDLTLRSLMGGGLPVSPHDLRVENATLEDLFLRLTGRGLQSGSGKKQTIGSFRRFGS